MPRIPQILSTGEVGGGYAPPRAPLSLADTSGTQQAIAQVGKAAQQFVTPKKVHDELAKLEAEQALTELERQFTDADLALKSDPSVTPEDYSRRTDDNVRAMRQGIGKGLRPESRMMFEVASERFYRQQSIKGKEEAQAMQMAQLKSGTDTALTVDANYAVVAETDTDFDAAVNRGLGRINNLTRLRGGLTGAEANEKKAGFLATIEEGQARKAAMNPLTRNEAIDDLVNVRFRYIKPDAQLRLADQLMRSAEAAQDKADAKIAKDVEADKQDAMTGFAQDAMNERKPPAVLLAELDRLSRQHRLKETEYARLHHLMDEKTKDAPSDPDTIRRVIADTHSMNPRLSEADLNGLYDQRLLNKKDWVGALDRRRETLESNRREGHSLVMQQHAQAEQEIMKAAGVITPFSQLDKTQEKLIPEVLTELRRRSNAYPGGKEAPLAVAESLLPRIRNTLGRDAGFTRQELEKQITYPTANALEEARRQNKISDGFYKSEKDRLLRLDEARKREQEFKEKTSQTGKPPASGGGSSLNPFGRPK